MPVNQQWPEVLAMVIADVVYQGTASGKFFILGAYTGLSCRSFPYTLASLQVFLSLPDGRGETDFVLRMVDVDESLQAVFEQTFQVHFRDPTDMLEMAVVEPDVFVAEPGEYRLELVGAGEFLRERRLWLLQGHGEEDS